MSDRFIGVCLGLLLGAPAISWAEEARKDAAVATVKSEDATVLTRAVKLPEGHSPPEWSILSQGSSVPEGRLLVGLPGAEIVSRNGTIRTRFLTDLNGKSPFPVIEAAIVPHGGETEDFAFTLDRGRVELIRESGSKPATVRVRFADRSWLLILKEKGTRVVIELFGRWPAGARFDPEGKNEPTRQCVVLVTRGRIELKTKSHRMAMSAPPGPALNMWDSVHGADRSAHALRELPEWVTEKASSEVARAKEARIETYRRMLAESKSVPATVARLFASNNPELRKHAPLVAGAVDALEPLADQLRASDDPEVWENAVIALRHWLGRGPGQDRLLYRKMTSAKGERKMSEAHARSIIQLLHGFGEEMRTEPVLYEMLIGLLDHERLGIRGLAAWHLHHLAFAPKIPFNPLAEGKEREKIIRAWRDLIPRGQVPRIAWGDNGKPEG